jgi:hypothetical protein
MSDEGPPLAQARPLSKFVVDETIHMQAVDDLEEELLGDEALRLKEKFGVAPDRKLHHPDQSVAAPRMFRQAVSQTGGPAQKPVVPKPQPSQQVREGPKDPLKKLALVEGEIGDGLNQFVGKFVGHGYNMILRPQNGPGFAFDNKGAISRREILIESNFTHEELSFLNQDVLKDVPNRGFHRQPDVILRGIPYQQVVKDLANAETSKADLTPKEAPTIHFEQGLFMRTPALLEYPKFEVDAKGAFLAPGKPVELLGPTVSRMASIPHGTTINAQSKAPVKVGGKPLFTNLEKTTINPFLFRQNPLTAARGGFPQIDNLDSIVFDRIPTKLPDFIKNNVITKEAYRNPENLLATYNKDLHIEDHYTFTVDTTPQRKPGIWGGGTGNIAQLAEPEVSTREVKVLIKGVETIEEEPILNQDKKPITRTNVAGQDRGSLANANAVRMTCTYWISTVKETIPVIPFNFADTKAANAKAPADKKQKEEDLFPASPSLKAPGGIKPRFRFKAPNVAANKFAEVRYTQIQYSQNVTLDFGGLSWPHISVNTLVPAEPLDIEEKDIVWKSSLAG